MVRILPIEPNLDHLKNEAKSLHKAHAAGDAQACTVLRHLNRFARATDEQILAAPVKLTEAQFALAREYGFPSWAKLRERVPRKLPKDFAIDAKDDAVILPDPPVGGTGPDRISAALAMLLGYLGAPVDHITVAGDLGMAFILQADSQHRPYGADVPNLDIGWWPLDGWGVFVRLGFLAQTSGIPLQVTTAAADDWRADQTAVYRRMFETPFKTSIDTGRPVISFSRDITLVVGYDSGDPPLLGQLSCSHENQIARPAEHPWQAIIAGEPGAPMDRAAADVAAIDYAVKLGRDEVDLSHLPGKSSGRQSWELWAAQLESEQLCGPHYYHNNVRGHLVRHREAASAYLREMGTRWNEPVRDALEGAAAQYDTVHTRMTDVDLSEGVMGTERGRRDLIRAIRACMDTEASAQAALSNALEAMRSR